MPSKLQLGQALVAPVGDGAIGHGAAGFVGGDFLAFGRAAHGLQHSAGRLAESCLIVMRRAAPHALHFINVRRVTAGVLRRVRTD